jgi:3-hydroxybutyryl-CoA dehydrogenase
MKNGADHYHAKPKPVIGVVGLGTMGLGMVQVFLTAGFRVVATDAYAPVLTTAPMRLAAALETRVQAGKMTYDARNAALRRLRLVDQPTDFGRASLVVEAIAEDLPAKRALFAALETVLAPDAVLATNTSSLSVASVAAELARPARVLGLHFFNPAPAMKLVELIAHRGTSDAALQTARSIAEQAGKTVITAPDTPGFIVNRCARPFYGEALAMLEEGIPARDIDAAMLAAGYKIGPFALIDLIGADIHLAATEGMSAAIAGHPRYYVFNALRKQVASGNLGRKTGRGFVFPEDAAAPPPNAADIALRIEAALINEAASLMAAGGVTKSAVDMAMRLGMNFPRGPFEALKTHGCTRILETLQALDAAAPLHLQGRYTPSVALAEPA